MARRLVLPLGLLMAFVMSLSTFNSSTPSWVRPRTIAAQNECQTFPETGRQVCGIFLSYWKANGGLAQQGFPISDVLREQSSNGQTYDTQYFERAVFERHPENAGTRFEVLLALLGRERYDRRFPAGQPSTEVPVQGGQVLILAGTEPGVTHRVEITEIRRTPTIGTASANGVFVVVLFKVTNLGTESASVSEFRVKDQAGRIFDESISGMIGGIGQFPGDNRLIGTFQPGVPTPGYTVFDVATDVATLTIVPR